MTRNTPELVAISSVLLLHGLTPRLLRRLLEALHCQTHRVETRLYIRPSTKRLITSLLAARYANTSLEEYVGALETTTFLYRCTSCGDLLFYTELLLGDQQLTHSCLLERRPRADLLGHLELVGSGPLRRLVEQHAKLFPIEIDLVSAA